jgi:hypothetical protein
MTKAFTYEVTMLVQVFAEDQQEAEMVLNEKGGYVSDRKVELKSTVDVESPKKLKSVKNKDMEGK